MNIPESWFFYWLIAAVVCTPIVLIVKGIMAGRHDARSNGTSGPQERPGRQTQQRNPPP
jgi:hypothetical protein